MNVYVETNFVLELTLLQDEQESCENILSLCESDRAKLIIPAYSLAEPNEPLIRRDRERKNELVPLVRQALDQLSRSAPYKAETIALQEQIVSLLIRSGVEERGRFAAIRQRLLQSAEIIPLNRDILSFAALYETQFVRSHRMLLSLLLSYSI